MSDTPDDSSPAAAAAGIDDDDAMRVAIAAARTAAARGDMPFGAALVSPGRTLLHVSANNQVTGGDCTGHAELVLVREVQATLGAAALRGATVYASGEPCAMCSGALFWAGVGRIVYAATTPDIAQALGGPLLPARCRDVLAGCTPAVQVDGPLQNAQAIEALRRR